MMAVANVSLENSELFAVRAKKIILRFVVVNDEPKWPG